MRKGQKINYYGFKYTVMDVVKDGVYIKRGNHIVKAKKSRCEKINKYTIK